MSTTPVFVDVEWRNVLAASPLAADPIDSAVFGIAGLKDPNMGRVQAIGFAVRVKITGGTSADVAWNVFSVPDMDLDRTASVAADGGLLKTSDFDPYHGWFYIGWETVGSGAIVQFNRTSAVAGMIVTADIQRYRWG